MSNYTKVIELKSNILVLNNHGLGDVVMSFLFFEKLLKKHHHSTIIVLLKSDLERDLFKLSTVYKGNSSRFRLYTSKEIAKLFYFSFRIREGYSLGVDSRKSLMLFRALFVRRFRVARPYRHEISTSSSILNNHDRLHKSLLYADLVKLDYQFEITKKEQFIKGFDKFKIQQDYVVIACGSGEIEKNKRWSVENFSTFIEYILKETNLNLVFVGSSNESVIVNDIESRVSKCDTNRINNLNGKTTLSELLYILGESKIVVCNDNGIGHIAAACGCNVLSMFGATDYTITGPIGESVEIIFHPEKCSPCYPDLDKMTSCNNNKCMKNISVDDLYIKFKSILKL